LTRERRVKSLREVANLSTKSLRLTVRFYKVPSLNKVVLGFDDQAIGPR